MSSTSTCKFSQQKFALYVVETSSFLTHKKRRKRVASIKNYKKIKRKLMASEVRVQWYFGAKDTIPLLCFQQRYLSRWCSDVHGFIQVKFLTRYLNELQLSRNKEMANNIFDDRFIEHGNYAKRISSLRSRRFRKLTRRKRNSAGQEGVRKIRRRGRGEASEGNACNQCQTFYRAPPNMPGSHGASIDIWETMIINFLLKSVQHGLDGVR